MGKFGDLIKEARIERELDQKMYKWKQVLIIRF